jgi:hypothetical protein
MWLPVGEIVARTWWRPEEAGSRQENYFHPSPGQMDKGQLCAHFPAVSKGRGSSVASCFLRSAHGFLFVCVFSFLVLFWD